MGKDNDRIKIGITCGDVNGIGLEVIIKSMLDNRILELATPILYASSKTTSQYRRLLEIKDFSFNEIPDAESANPKRANVINVWDDDIPLVPGTPTPESGALALRSLKAAVEDLKAGKIDALVTAPIDKHNIQSDEFKFPGHTEYLASEFGTEEYAMLMVSESVKVTIMTGHVPVVDISKYLSFESIIKKIRFLDRNLARDFSIRKPRIAVLGLNPHSGDGGLIGTEEQELIAPAIKKAKEDGILVFGPFSADGFFGSGAFKLFDVTLAMYHDQGLIPFKTLNFNSGVNYTAGLPVVRVSPDHGTGFDIAGKGIADPQSFRDAIYLAIDIVHERQRFDEYTENVLRPQKQPRSEDRGQRSPERRGPRKPRPSEPKQADASRTDAPTSTQQGPGGE